MKKIIITAVAALGFIALFIGIKLYSLESFYPVVVGVLQTDSNPDLDAARDGFIEELRAILDVEFVIQNAHGSLSQTNIIAQQFHADKKFKGFFAIGNAAAQAMSSLEKERPIFIAAVTNPQSLGLIHPTTNVCGVADMVIVHDTMPIKDGTPAHTIDYKKSGEQVASIAYEVLLEYKQPRNLPIEQAKIVITS